MFEIVQIEDQITVQAKDLDKDYAKHLQLLIEKKYHMNAIKNYGFCIKVLGIVSQSGHIYEGDSIFEVTLQVLVLKLLKDEVYYGKIIKSNQESVTIQFLGFKGVCKQFLNGQYENEWKAEWKGFEFFYDVGSEVRFKIVDVQWLDDYVINVRMDEPGLGGVNWWN